ncbi:MAG: hypothetical protein ACFE7R_07085 [Candidatus Hodarchaeota archaeon]
MLRRDFERGLLVATGLMLIITVVALISAIAIPEILFSQIAAGGGILGMGLLLIVGGCLMARQPMRDEDRFNPDGSASTQWKMALIGRQLLFAALILFLYGMLLSIAGSLLGF